MYLTLGLTRTPCELKWLLGMLLGRRYIENLTLLLRVAETNPSFKLTSGYRSNQSRLVFCSIRCS